jgi:Protein of unknown function (DUF4238)
VREQGWDLMLDHYVPQVHIRRFYSPALDERVYAIRKSDLRRFEPKSKGVCGVHDGSTNPFLIEDRAIEDFLRTIEPSYDSAVEKLATETIDQQCIYTIAGFVASVISCSPAGMRIHSGPLKSIVEATAAMLEAQGQFLPRPPSLVGVSLEAVIDRKYPQALGIDSIKHNTAMFGNFTWEILHNDFDDNPFFTSDFPVAIEKSDDPRVLIRIVALAPNLAIRILPDLAVDRATADFSFPHFRSRSHKLTRDRLLQINRLIVQCAEETVLFRDDHPWVVPFVAKNRNFRIEPYTFELRTPRGTELRSGQRVVERVPPRADRA